MSYEEMCNTKKHLFLFFLLKNIYKYFINIKTQEIRLDQSYNSNKNCCTEKFLRPSKLPVHCAQSSRDAEFVNQPQFQRGVFNDAFVFQLPMYPSVILHLRSVSPIDSMPHQLGLWRNLYSGLSCCPFAHIFKRKTLTLSTASGKMGPNVTLGSAITWF